VVCDTGLVIKGGLAGSQTRSVVTAEHKGETFVRMHKTEVWLCHAATGRARGVRPLKRTALLETISSLIDKVLAPAGLGGGDGVNATSALAPAGHVDDLMADLGLDEVAPAPRPMKISQPKT